MFQYLIIQNDIPPFYTNYYEYDNHYQKGMTVINLLANKYTNNGIDWFNINEDHL